MLSGVSGKLDNGSNTFFSIRQKYCGRFYSFFKIIYWVQKDIQLHFNTDFCVLFCIRKERLILDKILDKPRKQWCSEKAIFQGKIYQIISQNWYKWHKWLHFIIFSLHSGNRFIHWQQSHSNENDHTFSNQKHLHHWHCFIPALSHS